MILPVIILPDRQINLFGFGVGRRFTGEKKMTEARTLLAEYAQTGSEPAFRELVGRYSDLVYSTALRQVAGDRHLAEDVAQTVFLHLARKAARVPDQARLGGWLYQDTCHVAATVMRGERRRHARERRAAEMNSLQGSEDRERSDLLLALDSAINQLAGDGITMPVFITPQSDAKLKISGQTAIKMTDFRIDPAGSAPHFPVGLLRIGDTVTISFDWMLQRTNQLPAAAAQ